jgi:hypothetical protein
MLFAFKIFHTAISLIALVMGIFVIEGLAFRPVKAFWTPWFLGIAVATSVTGFMFPFNGVTPAFVTGIIALIVLAPTIYGNWVAHFRGAWRWIYAAGIVLSTYFLASVTVVQLFLKIPALHALAPMGSEPAFGVTQLVVLALFAWLGFVSVRRFRPARL